MNARPQHPLVIVGGGLAGCLVALALNRLRPKLPFLLLESGDRFGGNHLWSFFDPDIEKDDRWLVQPFIEQSWNSYDIRFPARRRTIKTGYSSASSSLLDQLVRAKLRSDQYRLGVTVATLTPKRIELKDGEVIEAVGVIDARGFPLLPEGQRNALDLAWQKFVGHDYRVKEGHRLDRPIVMDAMVEQIDGYRFVYSLPFDESRLLVEDTYYSSGAQLDEAAIGSRLESYLQVNDWQEADLEREEKGVLPVALGGDFDRFWPVGGSARIGVMGGFFHPTTGYSLPDAVRTAMLVAGQEDFAGEKLASLLRGEAKRLWQERRFYRLLNRMLFRAAQPAERYRVLEHFYRLDAGLIGRFYAARLRLWDKIRILSGKPPVPISRALAALFK